MTATELVEALRARGVTLEARGDRLRVAPASRLAPDELNRLRAAKTEVLALLAAMAREAAPAAAPCPTAAELARVLALPLDRLDCVLRVAVGWWPEPLYFVPSPEDTAALEADGVSRGHVWTAAELLDLLAVPGITKAGTRTVALAKLAVAGEVAEVRAIAPVPCHVCKGRSWWRSPAGRTVCRTCHPPAPGAEAGG